MKSQKYTQNFNFPRRYKQSRSLEASHYHEFTEMHRQRQSDSSIIRTEYCENNKRQLFHHRTINLEETFNKKKTQKKQLRKRKINKREKMYDQNNNLQQRRFSCVCNECGKTSTLMKKFHNIYIKKEKQLSQQFLLTPNIQQQQQQQSILTLSSKSLKSTATLISIPEISPNKIKGKQISPKKKTFTSPRFIPNTSLHLRPYLYEASPRKITSLKTEQTSIIIKPITLRASAPNLDIFDTSSLDQSPKRGKSNSNIRNEVKKATLRKLIYASYCKLGSTVSLQNNILSLNKLNKKNKK